MEPRNNIIAFTGNLPRTIYRAVLQWKKLFQEKFGEFGISHISLGGFYPEELAAEIGSFPFLIEKKLIIISVQTEWNPGNISKYGDESFWKSVLESTPNETTLVFYGFKPTSIESAQKSYTRTKKTSTSKSKKANTLSQEVVEKVLLGAITEIGKEKKYLLSSESDSRNYIFEQLPGISRENIELLLRRIWTVPESIENEVQKLALTAWGITQEIIQENTRENHEINAFEVLDCLIAWNGEKAFSLIQKQLLNEDGIILLRGYIGALRKPALYCSLILWKKTAATALKISGIHEYAAKKYFALTEKRKLALIQFYLGCIEIDLQGKTGQLIGDSNGYEHGILTEILRFNIISTSF